MRRRRRVGWLGALAAVTLGSGCLSVLGDFSETGAAATTTGPGGTGGDGGAGPPCEAGATEACYDGTAATAHKGICADGTRTCGADGTWSACEGQVLPELIDDCAAPEDEDCDGVVCSELHWGAVWGEDYEGAGRAAAYTVAFTPTGETVVGGSFRGLIDFSGNADLLISSNSQAIFFTRFDPDGTSIDNSLHSYDAGASPFDLAITGDGGMVVAGGFEVGLNFFGAPLTSQGLDDAFVMRLDPGGSALWGFAFGDASAQRATTVLLDPEGDILLAGSFSGAMDFGGGATVSAAGVDAFVAKLDGMSGAGIWAMSYGDPSVDDAAPAIAVDAAGEVLLAGSFQGTMALGSTLSAPTDRDIYVAKLDAGGAAVWGKSFAGAGDQAATGVGADADGFITIGGWMRGSMDFGLGALTVPDATADAVVARLSAAGAPVAARRFDDSGDTLVTALLVDAAGDVVTSGSMTASVDLGGGLLTRPDGDATAFVAKLDPALGHRWSKAFAVTSALGLTDLAVDPTSRSVAITGTVAGSIDYGGGVMTSLAADGAATAAVFAR